MMDTRQRRLSSCKLEFARRHTDICNQLDVLVIHGYMLDDKHCKFDRFVDTYNARYLNNRAFVEDQWSIPILNKIEEQVKRTNELSKMMDRIMYENYKYE